MLIFQALHYKYIPNKIQEHVVNKKQKVRTADIMRLGPHSTKSVEISKETG